MFTLSLNTAIWLCHLAATTVMLGVVWYAQLVRYPSFGQIPADQFVEYHRRYTMNISWIVGPAMILELLSGFALLATASGPCFAGIAASMVMLAIIWISTFMIQVPCHHALGQGFHMITHRRLVSTNWVRTVFWSARWLLVISTAIAANCT